MGNSDLETFRSALAAVKPVRCLRCDSPGPLTEMAAQQLFWGHMDFGSQRMRNIVLLPVLEAGWGMVALDTNGDVAMACPECSTTAEVERTNYELALFQHRANQN